MSPLKVLTGICHSHNTAHKSLQTYHGQDSATHCNVLLSHTVLCYCHTGKKHKSLSSSHINTCNTGNSDGD